MLVWHLSYFVDCSTQKKKKKKKKKKRKNNEKKKKKSYAYSIFTLLVFGISMVCQRYYGLIIRGHFGFERFLFSFENRVRALYDPSHHRSGRHIRSEVWVSLASLIILYITIPVLLVTCFDLAFWE